jgi:hypothetical protein
MDTSLTPEIFWAAAGVIVAAIGVVVGVLYPIRSERKNRRILSEKFSRGPYDQATIDSATRYYIRPKCSNVDPAKEEEIRRAVIVAKEDLFAIVDQFLEHDDVRRHLLILADSGTGKTSFVLNYYVHNAHRSKRKRHKLALVPLSLRHADELIKNVPEQEQGETVIFLDALDEDTKAIEDHHARVRSLMESCSRFKRVIITCRTQFFPTDEEIPVETVT